MNLYKTSKGVNAVVPMTDQDKKQLVADFASGLATAKELSKRFGCSTTTIYNIVKREKEFADRVTDSTEKITIDLVAKKLEERADSLLKVSEMAIDRLKETLPNASPLDAAKSLRISVEALMAIIARRDEQRTGDGTPAIVNVSIADCSGVHAKDPEEPPGDE